MRWMWRELAGVVWLLGIVIGSVAVSIIQSLYGTLAAWLAIIPIAWPLAVGAAKLALWLDRK